MPCCDQSQHLCFTPLPLYSIPVTLTLVEKPFFLLKFPWFSSMDILCEGCLSINRKWTLDGLKSKTWNLFHETTYLKSYSWKKVNKEVWKKMEEIAPLFFPPELLAGSCWRLPAQMLRLFPPLHARVRFAQVLSRVLHTA